MTLVLLLLIPFAAGLLAWQGEHVSKNTPRWIALIASLTVIALGLVLWCAGDFSFAGGVPVWQSEFRMPWIERFGIAIHLAIDGLGLLMVLLTGLLGVVAVLASWQEVQERVGLFHLNLLWILSGVLGIFLAVDLFLFFVFWEAMLVPMYFLVALWGRDAPGGLTRMQASIKFMIYTQAGGLLMLLAILGLVFVHHDTTGTWTFALDKLRGTVMAPETEMLLMLGFFIAFAVKLPIVPLHGWLADTHAAAPTAGSVDITGLLLKTAAFGLLRFALPLFPNASLEFAPVAMALAIVTIVWGGVLAFAQTHTKRLLAYASISHMGFILLGIYAGNLLGLQGTVILMLAGALSTGALFVIVGQVFERTGTFDTAPLGGLWTRLSLIPPFALFFAAATLGLPGLGNFVGEFLVLFGAWKVAPGFTAAATIGLVLAAVYALALVHRVFFGPAKTDATLPGATPREAGVLALLAVLLIALGFYPQPALDLSHSGMQAVEQQLHRPAATADHGPIVIAPLLSAPPTGAPTP
ncbi:MAG: NADH-quinone oxidoreductase subunit M [Pseudomonadota bacterium]